MQFKKNLSSFSTVTLVLAALCVPAAVMAGPFAYVPNEKSGTLSVIDTENDTVVSEIKAGNKPRGLAVSIDGKTLYVTSRWSGRLSVVDLVRGQLVRQVRLPPEGPGY